MHGLAWLAWQLQLPAFAGNAWGGAHLCLWCIHMNVSHAWQLQGFHTQPCTCTCTWLYHYILVLSTSMHCIIVYTFAYILTSSVQYVLCPQNMIVHMNTYTCSCLRDAVHANWKLSAFRESLEGQWIPFFVLGIFGTQFVNIVPLLMTAMSYVVVRLCHGIFTGGRWFV